MSGRAAEGTVSVRSSRLDAGLVTAAIVIGVAIGAVTSVGQAHLDLPWSALVNSASPWLVGGFVAGMLQRGSSLGILGILGILGGLAACVAEVLGYYAVSQARGYPVNSAEVVFWAACGLLGGPLFGWAGWAWRRGSGGLRAWGASLPPATFLAEAVGTYQLRLHYHSAVVLYLGIWLGLLVLVTLSRPVRRHLLTLVAVTAGTSLAGILVYWQLLTLLAGARFSA